MGVAGCSLTGFDDLCDTLRYDPGEAARKLSSSELHQLSNCAGGIRLTQLSGDSDMLGSPVSKGVSPIYGIFPERLWPETFCRRLSPAPFYGFLW